MKDLVIYLQFLTTQESWMGVNTKHIPGKDLAKVAVF